MRKAERSHCSFNQIEEPRWNSAQQLDDAERLTQFIEDMETTSILARNACEKSGKVGAPLKNAVLQAHRQLAVLNNQLVG